ncbi:MAG: NADPH-dependent reductase [Myxococcales bacterium]|nr:NADPH-dependent reductase [Myxococcales bacterium]
MTEKIRLAVVICSTRPGRHGGTIAKWAFEHASAHPAFTPELVDLATFNLPLLDEPHHPRLANYTKDHTKAWSAKVAATEAFVWVTPEYDFAMPATLLNALQFLSQEWKHKACAFVSYGGISGGTRGVQMSKQVVTSLGMMPIPEAVAQPFFTSHIKDGVFAPADTQDKAAVTMLDALATWSKALAPLRA